MGDSAEGIQPDVRTIGRCLLREVGEATGMGSRRLQQQAA
jgi:hypothetical protein